MNHLVFEGVNYFDFVGVVTNNMTNECFKQCVTSTNTNSLTLEEKKCAASCFSKQYYASLNMGDWIKSSSIYSLNKN